MKSVFFISGHENLLGTHKKTLEFTKERNLTKNGDCIVGINADFNMTELKKFLVKNKIKITVELDYLKETITAEPNPEFDDDKEIVIRLGSFKSKRTFAFNADKAACNINKGIINRLKDPNAKAKVTIECDS